MVTVSISHLEPFQEWKFNTLAASDLGLDVREQ